MITRLIRTQPTPNSIDWPIDGERSISKRWINYSIDTDFSTHSSAIFDVLNLFWGSFFAFQSSRNFSVMFRRFGFAATKLKIMTIGAWIDIINRIWASISIAAHTILLCSSSTKMPVAAIKPPFKPGIKGKVPFNISLFSSCLLFMIRFFCAIKLFFGHNKLIDKLMMSNSSKSQNISQMMRISV